MFRRLQNKWKVSGVKFFLIMLVFAVTGTTTAYISAVIRNWIGFSDTTPWFWKLLLSLSVLVFGYQIILLSVAFLLGQFSFFWKYEKRILAKVGLIKVDNSLPITNGIKVYSSSPESIEKKNENETSNTKIQTLKNITIFASGAGSNALEIINYFKKSELAKVGLIVCNTQGAGVLTIAAKENIPVLFIEKEHFFNRDSYVTQLQNAKTDLVVLAGFVWKIPLNLIQAFPKRIINIHPALLPKYGGKGMYGAYVHQLVLDAGEVESGITIHYVDEHYDNGAVIFQTGCPVLESDTPETLAQRIHRLEYLHYPKVIEKVLKSL